MDSYKGMLSTRRAPNDDTPYGSDADVIDIGEGQWLSITEAIEAGYLARDERSGAISEAYRPGVRIDY